MESKDILVFVFVFIALGFSLYRKYIKKNQQSQTDKKANQSSGSFGSVKDDYEPYSKK
jgi:preprotein translocase subunit SecG